ncbi:MAG: FliM/FliN family flagellar motor switch protein [Acidobacteriaceae bacterium]
MRNFLAVWGEAFPDAVMQKLGVEVSWESCDELPAQAEALAVEMRWEGEWNGRCTLVGAWAELAQLMGESAAEGIPDGAAGKRWEKWVRETVEGMLLPAHPVAIALVERPRGLPLAPYVLRAGEMAVHLAMVPEIRTIPGSESAAAGLPPLPGDGSGNAKLDLLLDIEVDVSLRFGSRELALRELLATGPGDVLELDRTITDPVDLVVGDKIVARGEVVLVNGNFGLRVTEVAEPRKCLESVRCLF